MPTKNHNLIHLHSPVSTSTKMISYHHSPPFLAITITSLLLLFAIQCTESQVPADKTFTYVNQGEFGDYITEYDASYRIVQTNQDNTFRFPFQLFLYNTTPGAYVFAIRAGVPRDEDLMRWVWDANRNNPVGENATLSLGRDGNLVLAEADGTVTWQTNTANRGVIGMELLETGNLVLRDRRGRFVWQSFDHPVDTLLAGMSLKINGKNKLVSRTSDADGSDGVYSLVVEKRGVILYVENSGKLLRYGGWLNENSVNASFVTEPENENATAYELLLDIGAKEVPPPARRRLLQSRPSRSGGSINLVKRNYNATISFLKLGSDGNLKAYTYYPQVSYLRWEESFAYFSDDYVSECLLPSKCGQYGFCRRAMCVACPTAKGLLGWSEGCVPPDLGRCRGGAKVDYYKIAAAEHFLSRFATGDGPIKVEQCRDKCSKDCKCKGFVYKEDTSMCFIAPLLATIAGSVNTSSVYVKYLK